MQKIHGKAKLILYAASGMGVNMLNLMMTSYLCSALIAGGFAEKALPFQTYLGIDLVIPALWATVALIAKILDGVIDIPMASLTDRMHTRWGRRRPSLVLGLVPMIVSFLLFLVVPDPTANSLFNTIYYGFILCVFYTFYTLTMVTYYATFTEIVDTEEERNFLSNVKSFFDIVYFILGYVGVRAMLNGLNVRLVALIVLPLVLTMVIPLFMIKEDGKTVGEIGQSVNLFKSLKHTFANGRFILWMVVYSFMTFGVQLFLGGINEFFSFVNMNMIFVMMSSFAPVPFTLILYDKVLRKKGFGFAFRYILLTFSIGMLCLFGTVFMPLGTMRTVASIVSGIICAFAVGALFAVAYSVPSQLAAEEEEKTGISNSAMYFAVQGLFSGVASGIGTAVVLTALKNASGNSTPEFVAADYLGHGMTYLTLVAGLGTLVAFLLTFLLPKSIVKMGKTDKKGL